MSSVEFLLPVPEYEGYYASDCGKVYFEKDDDFAELSVSSLEKGLSCILLKKGKENIRLIEKVVASTWHPLKRPEHIIYHLDKDVANNSPSNLRWMKNDMCVIPGFDDYYVSRTGQIFSVKVGKMIEKKFYNAKDGYCTVGLTANGSGLQKRYRVHVIVAKTWFENSDNLPTVNHKDGNGRNNSIDNLEWMSYSDQGKHAHKAGLIKTKTSPVCQADEKGNLIAEFASIKEASEATGISISMISGNCVGKYRMAGGFVWHYKKNFKGQKKRKFGNCKTVYQYSLEGKFIKEFESVNEAAKAMGVSPGTMADACRGGQNTCQGFFWKYAPKEEKTDYEKKYKDWKTLKEFPKYRISNDGRVFSFFHKKELKPSVRKNNIKTIPMTNKDGVSKTMAVHRLVARAYIPNPEKYEVVNHLDGNPSNNNVENLEWTDHAGNGQHAYDTGLNSNKHPVIRLGKNGKEIARYEGVKEAAEDVGVSRTALSYALNGKTKTCCGSKWIYA